MVSPAVWGTKDLRPPGERVGASELMARSSVAGTLKQPNTSYTRQGALDALKPGDTRAITMAQNNLPTVTGQVESINDGGFKLNNYPQWLNFSQYGYHGTKYAPYTPAPQAGQTVTVRIKNDKFIDGLTFGDAAPQAAQPQATQQQATAQPAQNSVPTPPALTPVVQDNQQQLINLSVETRQTLLKTLAVAKPDMFTLEGFDTLTELVRNLEQFVLEDLIAATTPESDDDVTEDDVLDDAV